MNLHPGEKMMLYRTRKNMSQEKLAMAVNEKYKLHTYQMQISRIERGEIPELILMMAIEKVLGAVIWSDQFAENEKKLV
ncbi:transcriptional regulator with XRE-family HTH domain [Paenibacillus mucilaginosus]|uniref:helix-turn-helix domain-containing protein n=1 Tax=Paenibacillus mucilaginosus TaxID=61624 RepID=UPI003D1E9123